MRDGNGGVEVIKQSDELAKVHALIGDVDKLPTPPAVLTQINRMINDEETSAYDIGHLISEDMGLSAQVLKVANSAYIGLVNPINSVKQAVVILGMNEIRNIVMASWAMSAFGNGSDQGEYQNDFWRHSLAVAAGARMLQRTQFPDDILEAEVAFSAGLLHDIGKMVIYCRAYTDHEQIRKNHQTSGKPELLVEREHLSLDHTLVGQYIAEYWKLPSALAAAIRFHHTPGESEAHREVIAAVNVADYLAHRTFKIDNDDDDESTAFREFLPPDSSSIELLQLASADFHRLEAALMEEYTKSETFLRMAAA